jgi:diguanylate cyclase (GGDEF)-like protein/PAS domain S-box-containing protein
MVTMNEAAYKQWCEKRRGQIMGAVDGVLWEMDARFVYTAVSPRDRDQRGYNPSDVLGRSWFSFVPAFSQQQIMSEIVDYARAASVGSRPPLVLKRVQQVCKDGGAIWTDVVLTPVLENGIVTGFVGATRDVTALRQAEDQLGVCTSQLEQLRRELELSSKIDQLTGLLPRQSLKDVWEQEVSRVKRYGTSLAVAIANIDFFRKINETHGHEGADGVLRDAGRTIKRFIRSNDTAIRWGNDEFLFLLPHTSRDQGLTQAERLRNTFQEQRFSIPDKVTISLGLTEYIDGDTAETAVTRADRALYIAKRAGHNRVEVR